MPQLPLLAVAVPLLVLSLSATPCDAAVDGLHITGNITTELKGTFQMFQVDKKGQPSSCDKSKAGPHGDTDCTVGWSSTHKVMLYVEPDDRDPHLFEGAILIFSLTISLYSKTGGIIVVKSMNARCPLCSGAQCHFNDIPLLNTRATWGMPKCPFSDKYGKTDIDFDMPQAFLPKGTYAEVEVFGTMANPKGAILGSLRAAGVLDAL